MKETAIDRCNTFLRQARIGHAWIARRGSVAEIDDLKAEVP